MNDFATGSSDWPRVYVVIVNYRNSTDTVECLESLLRNDYPNYRIIVIDNGEDEKSIDELRMWAEGKTPSPCSTGFGHLRHLSYPPIPKPIHYLFRDRAHKVYTCGATDGTKEEILDGFPLVLIHEGKNYGFAGGINIAIRYALSIGDCDFILLLNNDTVVERGFIFPLVETYKTKSFAGLIGGLVKYYSDPKKIWFSRGSFHWYKEGVHSNELLAGTDIVSSDFITGCLMLIPRSVIERVGMLPEEYFLYGEDTDYSLEVLRGGYRNFDNHRSVIFHKVSRATGGRFSKVAYYYSTRNRLYYHYKHYGRFDFVFFAAIFIGSKLGRLIQFLITGDMEAMHAMMRGIVDFFKMRRHRGPVGSTRL